MRRVGLLLFDDVEVLDACGPFEVFSVASRIADVPPFDVVTLSAGRTLTVHARGGLPILAHRMLTDAPPVDVAVVPGGVVDRVERDAAVRQWVRAAAAHAEVVASVCTGAFPLAAAGLLDGLTVTTHWEDQEELRRRYPTLTVVDGVRYLDHGRVATSAGVSAGIDLALHLVARFAGARHAAATARQMDYPWADRPVGSAA